MILLDTNVLSEFMRPRPEPRVIAWLDEQRSDALFISAVSRAEIELGLALMPSGRRQRGLAAAAKAMFEVDFAGRCLPFDDQAAGHYGAVVATRTRMGRPISVEDAQIAAIALAGNRVLATRNTVDFDAIAGLTTLNPWQ